MEKTLPIRIIALMGPQPKTQKVKTAAGQKKKRKPLPFVDSDRQDSERLGRDNRRNIPGH